jgi:hypothetical protein
MAWWDFGADKLFHALGPSSGEKSAQGLLAGLGSFAGGEGKSDILTADKFWSSILSGDPSKISSVLGPEISAINKQGQQSKKTTSEFGNRGGGTNAAMQMTDDNTRSSIDSLFADLTKSAASNLGASGHSLLSEGISADTGAFGAARDIKSDWMNNILGLLNTGVSAAGAA